MTILKKFGGEIRVLKKLYLDADWRIITLRDVNNHFIFRAI